MGFALGFLFFSVLGCGLSDGIQILLFASPADFDIVAHFFFPSLSSLALGLSLYSSIEICVLILGFFSFEINIINAEAVTQEMFESFHSGYLNPVSG